MKNFKLGKSRIFMATFVAVCFLTGVVYAATTAGGSTDPLVSLSYFTQTIVPDLLSDVESEAEDVRDDMTADFDDKIAAYEAEIADLMAQVEASQGTSDVESAAYSVLTLQPGETVSLNAGDEVMLRIGTATVTGGTPALISTTDGTSLSSGGSLVTNHLYLCTINGRTLTAGSSETWILLRS